MHVLQINLLRFLTSVELLLLRSVVFLNIILFFKTHLPLLSDPLVVFLIFPQNTCFLSLVFIIPCGFHLSIFLFEHFILELLLQLEFNHIHVMTVSLLPCLLHPLRLFPSLIDLLHHTLFFFLKNFDPILHELCFYLSCDFIILCLK
jgi:hypothetical protein